MFKRIACLVVAVMFVFSTVLACAQSADTDRDAQLDALKQKMAESRDAYKTKMKETDKAILEQMKQVDPEDKAARKKLVEQKRQEKKQIQMQYRKEQSDLRAQVDALKGREKDVKKTPATTAADTDTKGKKTKAKKGKK